MPRGGTRTSEPVSPERFLSDVDRTFARIRERPLQFPTVAGDVRRALLHTFPYAVYFRASDEIVSRARGAAPETEPEGVAGRAHIRDTTAVKNRRRSIGRQMGFEPDHFERSTAISSADLFCQRGCVEVHFDSQLMAVLSWDAEKLAIAEFFQFPRSTASPQVAGDSELRRVCGFWCIELDAWID